MRVEQVRRLIPFEYLSSGCNSTCSMGSHAGICRMEQRHMWHPTQKTFQTAKVPQIYHLVTCHHCGAALVAQVSPAHLQLSRHNK